LDFRGGGTAVPGVAVLLRVIIRTLRGDLRARCFVISVRGRSAAIGFCRSLFTIETFNDTKCKTVGLRAERGTFDNLILSIKYCLPSDGPAQRRITCFRFSSNFPVRASVPSDPRPVPSQKYVCSRTSFWLGKNDHATRISERNNDVSAGSKNPIVNYAHEHLYSRRKKFFRNFEIIRILRVFFSSTCIVRCRGFFFYVI